MRNDAKKQAAAYVAQLKPIVPVHSQELLVMDYIRKHGSITGKEANEELGVTRLPAIIWKLIHKRGFPITYKDETAKNRFGVVVCYRRYMLP